MPRDVDSLLARDVIAHLRDGLVLADAEGRVIQANAAAQRILGCSLTDLRGKTLPRLVQRLDPQGELSKTRTRSPDDPPVVRTAETPEGRSIELSSGWVRDRRGNRIGRFLVLGDRTEQRRLERRRHLTQRLESLGVLAAGIAHEINNPLAFVRANLTHVIRVLTRLENTSGRAGPAPNPDTLEVREALEESVAGLDRIAAIVAGVRRLSRDAPKRLGPVDFNEVVREAMQLAALHENRAVPVEIDLDANLPSVFGSVERVGQVLLNLLINAKQVLSGRRDGKIRVETRTQPNGIEIRVHDNGPGIPVDIVERVFDPFFTTKDPDKGTGLGLAIAFDIVREHGGMIEAGASPLGGACFTIRLPSHPRRSLDAP